MNEPVQPPGSKPAPQDGESSVAGFFERHPVIAVWFDRFMTLLLLALVFCIGGASVFLRVAREWSGMTPRAAWVSFGIGGMAAAGWLLRIYFRKTKPPVI